jgi:hypothetical protein
MAKEGLLSTLGQLNTNPLGMLGIGNPAAAPSLDPTGAASFEQASDGNDTPIEVTGDGWKPHSPTILGALADAFLQSRGLGPAFAQNREMANMQEALQNMTTDPLQAIKRVAKIRGHADDAFKMYNTYVDNKRTQDNLDRQNKIIDLRNDDYINQMVAGMMNRANPDTWSQMRDLAIKRAQARGYTGDIDSLIPEQYDPDSINYMVAGVIKPKDQEKLTETNRHNTVREGQMQEGVDERVRHNQVSEGQAATNEAGRNNRFQQGEAGKNSRAAQRPAASPDRLISTKYGPGKVFNKGKNLSVKAGKKPDGTDRYAIYESKGPNQWHLVGYQ